MDNRSNLTQKDYDFDIVELVKTGWQQIDGVKAQFIAAMLIYIAAMIVVQLFLGIFFPTGSAENPNIVNQQIVGILSYPVLMPLLVGIMMMAIEYSRGKQITFKSIFNYYQFAGKLALASIIIHIFTLLGLMLFILPAIYVSVAYVFTMPLIVDKGMDVWEAMEYSRKTVTKHWFKVAGLMALLSIMIVLGAMAMGIGLIWAVPLMFVTLYGLAYPIMFEDEA